MFGSYGISCKISANPFIGSNIAGLVSATYKKPIVAFVRRQQGGGDHVVVCDGFVPNTGELVVCDPDPNTDRDNTCVVHGIDPEKGAGPRNEPPMQFGNDLVGYFTGVYLYNFKQRSDYKASIECRKPQ